MKQSKHSWSGFFLLVGIWLRGRGLPLASIWYDEAFSLELTRLPLLDLVRAQFIDFNPPLWELVLFPFARLSENVLSLRLPSLLASIGALYVFWKIMDALEFSDNQRFLSCLLAGLLPGHFLVAQDARVYSLLTLLFMASILFAIQGRLLGLTAVSGLMLYSHSVAAVFVVTAYLLVWYFHPDKTKRIIISGAAAVIAWLPWFPSLINANGDFWLDSLSFQYFSYSALKALWADSLSIQWETVAIIHMYFYSMVGAMITISVAMPFLNKVAAENIHQARAALRLVFGKNIAARVPLPDLPDRFTDPVIKKEDIPIPPLGIAALFPLLMMVFISLIFNNVVFYRTLLLLLLPFSLWLGAATAPVESRWYKWILPSVWAALMVVSLAGFHPATKGGGLEEIAGRINSQLSASGEDVVFYATGTAALPFEYYLTTPHQAYIMDAVQHDGLLRNELQDIFGYQKAVPAQADPDWIIIPRDPIIDQAVVDVIEAYLAVSGALTSTRVEYWQAADIDVYEIEVER